MRLVLCGEGPCEPSTGLLAYLHEWPPSLADPVHVLFGMRRTPPPIPPSPKEGLTFGSLMPGRGLKAVSGVRYHRLSYAQVCEQLMSGDLRFDALVACATRVARDGTRSLGAVNGYMQLAIDTARVIVVEEVGWLPTIPGAGKVARWDSLVASDSAPDTLGPPLARQFDSVDEVIADRIVNFLQDDITLSLGIGRIPSAVAHRLRGQSGIDLVGGAVTETVRQLYDTFPKSSLKPVRAMSVVGSAELLRWAACEEHVELLPSTAVHNPQWLGAIRNFVTILGALSVDRHGNVNSELVGARVVSGVGGAPDLARGAHLSQGGKCVVALRSKSPDERAAFVDAIAMPTIRAKYVDAIASERGLAEMCANPSLGRADLHRLFASSTLANGSDG
jgi:acyl-CoA hydrolase